MSGMQRNDAPLVPADMTAADRRDLLLAMLKMLGHALCNDARLEDMDAKELYEYMAMMQRVA